MSSVPTPAPFVGPAPRPPSSSSPSSSPSYLASNPAMTTNRKKKPKTTLDILTSRAFYVDVTPRLCAGGVLGIILGSGFGTMAALEVLKLETPRAKAAITNAIEQGKTPAQAIEAGGRATGLIPSIANLKKHRGIVGKTVGNTTLAFGGFLGSYFALQRVFDHVLFPQEKEAQVESVLVAAAVVGLPSAIFSTTIRSNLPVLGFCVAMDCYQVVVGSSHDDM